MTTYFGYFTIIRPYLKNLEISACKANHIHVIREVTRLTYALKRVKMI